MENPLVVFVSSMIGELREERRAVKEAIESIPLTRPWIFEYTPASTDRLEDSYLRWVRGCDMFILLLAHSISDPVRREWRIAVAHDKPRLVFLKDVERDPEAQAFVEQVDVKWAKFSTTDELRRQVQEAMADELIEGYRRYSLKTTEVSNIILEQFSSAYQKLRTLVPAQSPALGQLVAGLERFGVYHEQISEWKELHHLLQEIITLSAPFLCEVELLHNLKWPMNR